MEASNWDTLLIKDALPEFYRKYNLEIDGGVADDSVKIVLWKLIFYIPNFEARRKVVAYHDIHHLATGYSALFSGETEISAWELSAGCHNNWVAFLINTYAMMIGLIINPIRIWKAWKRGRNTKSLYFLDASTDELLNHKIASVKGILSLDQEVSAFSFSMLTSFLGMILLGFIISIASIVLIPLVIMYSIYVSLFRKNL